jgi:hypothetical protein
MRQRLVHLHTDVLLDWLLPGHQLQDRDGDVRLRCCRARVHDLHLGVVLRGSVYEQLLVRQLQRVLLRKLVQDIGDGFLRLERRGLHPVQHEYREQLYGRAMPLRFEPSLRRWWTVLKQRDLRR